MIITTYFIICILEISFHNKLEFFYKHYLYVAEILLFPVEVLHGVSYFIE